MNAPPRKRNPGGGRGSVETIQRASANRSTEQPEFGNRRRAFLIAMFMLGAVPPERVVERVLADVEADALVAGLAKVGCPAHVEVADPRADYEPQPGEPA